jgi:hypothetical protein
MAIYLITFAICAVLAVLHQLDLLRLKRKAYASMLLVIGVFAGLRHETGQDWPAYEAFFENLDLAQSPFRPDDRIQFEIAYYSLNYAVKWLGGSYSVVQLLASVFCSFAVYRVTRRFAVNRFYVLTIYVGYSFLILHFAQVRQSIAIGFFLLACDHFLRHEKKPPALLIAMIGPLFQFSSLMYVALLILVFLWPKPEARARGLAMLGIGAAAVIAMSYVVDAYGLLALVATSSAEEKIAIYQSLQVEQGPGQLVYSAYLTALALYFFGSLRYVPRRRLIIVRYAIVSLLLSVLFTLIFPGTYAMYSRAYVVACLFQGYAAAIVYASRKGWLPSAVFAASLLMSAAYYWRLLSLYADQYTPYRSILFSF